MPWPQSDLLTMKKEFILLALQPEANLRLLFRRYGISAACGYKWLRAYQEKGFAGLEEKSRRPHAHPDQTKAQMETQILSLRDQHPAWGGRKLKRRLEDLGVEQVPAASTITEILRRNGRLSPAHPSAQGPWQRFEYGAANELWQMDFKGPISTVGRQLCYPLTILDDHSRFNLALEACQNQQSGTVKERLWQVFERYGLPNGILCDNGSPWGSAQAACPYTEFGVWLLRLGVELIHGRVYHPQTQGKEERFHRSLQAEVLNQTTVWLDLAHGQARFDPYRNCYNTERPHEALQLRVPASCYQASLRAPPHKLPELQYLQEDFPRLVRTKGEVKFMGHLFYVGQAFGGLHVAFRPTPADGCFDLFFGWKKIGYLDLRRAPKDKQYRLWLTSRAPETSA
jgi:transposase InsO family protein